MRNDSRACMKHIISCCLLTTLIFVLSGCQVSPTATKENTIIEPALSPVPKLPITGADHYSISPNQSEIRILVYKGGPLAKFGHNHVMLAKQVTGDIYETSSLHDSAFILSFPVEKIEIDPPDARAQEGKEFDTRPSPEAIDGTRKNMLGPEVLDAEHYPDITIRSAGFYGPDKNTRAKIQITMHGVTRELSTPVSIEQYGSTLTADGKMIIRTSDFGIKPFSVLGGGLQVQDEVKIRFHIVAEKT